MEITRQLAAELKIGTKQVEQTVELLDGGNTIPFIARYRKEATGELDETVIRELSERLTYLRNLAERKADVARLIEEQEKNDTQDRGRHCQGHRAAGIGRHLQALQAQAANQGRCG